MNKNLNCAATTMLRHFDDRSNLLNCPLLEDQAGFKVYVSTFDTFFLVTLAASDFFL